MFFLNFRNAFSFDFQLLQAGLKYRQINRGAAEKCWPQMRCQLASWFHMYCKLHGFIIKFLCKHRCSIHVMPVYPAPRMPITTMENHVLAPPHYFCNIPSSICPSTTWCFLEGSRLLWGICRPFTVGLCSLHLGSSAVLWVCSDLGFLL